VFAGVLFEYYFRRRARLRRRIPEGEAGSRPVVTGDDEEVSSR
jgi:hypothetical protein